jgi:predicted Zn-dependent peptidase
MIINNSRLTNNILIASDQMPDAQTVVLYVCVRVGSKYEDKDQNGISHFLEHMAFKGTKSRTYKQIASTIDNVGGIINAYTSKEHTCYHVKVIKKDLELAFDILSDIIQNSIFLEEEIEKERGVILQELAASLDSPSDVAFDMFSSIAFKDLPLGRTILGTAENISSFQRQDFIEYIDKYYYAGNIIIATAGNASHEEVLKLGEKYFSQIKDSNKNTKHEKNIYKGGRIIKSKNELEQTQFILGFKSYSHKDDKKFYATQIASSILGDGMSSRLFQEIREKRGLVYSVSTFGDYYDDIGLFGIYAGTSSNKLQELSESLLKELESFNASSITEEEVDKVINQFSAGLLMSSESSNARAQKLAYNFIRYNRYIPHAEIIEKVKSITKEEIASIVAEMLESKNATLSVYGNKINEESLQILDKITQE